MPGELERLRAELAEARAEADGRQRLVEAQLTVQRGHEATIRELRTRAADLETEVEQLRPAPCNMTHTPPFDFAQCETHDETFALGQKCRFDGREVWEVFAEEADEQRQRAVKAEMALARGSAELEETRQQLRDHAELLMRRPAHPPVAADMAWWLRRLADCPVCIGSSRFTESKVCEACGTDYRTGGANPIEEAAPNGTDAGRTGRTSDEVLG